MNDVTDIYKRATEHIHREKGDYIVHTRIAGIERVFTTIMKPYQNLMGSLFHNLVEDLKGIKGFYALNVVAWSSREVRPLHMLLDAGILLQPIETAWKMLPRDDESYAVVHVEETTCRIHDTTFYNRLQNKGNFRIRPMNLIPGLHNMIHPGNERLLMETLEVTDRCSDLRKIVGMKGVAEWFENQMRRMETARFRLSDLRMDALYKDANLGVVVPSLDPSGPEGNVHDPGYKYASAIFMSSLITLAVYGLYVTKKYESMAKTRGDMKKDREEPLGGKKVRMRRVMAGDTTKKKRTGKKKKGRACEAVERTENPIASKRLEWEIMTPLQRALCVRDIIAQSPESTKVQGEPHEKGATEEEDGRKKDAPTEGPEEISAVGKTTAVTENRMCVVCLERERDVVFQPCYHLVCCQPCGILLGKCPICRGEISEYNKVYM